MHRLTASDRSALIRLAASLPKGSNERRAILAGLSKREAAFDHRLQKGDIFASSWGYEQTNVSFYEVVASTAATATLRRIESRIVSGRGGFEEMVVPVPGAYKGTPLNRKVRPGWRSGTVAVKINDYETAYTWDGKPQYQTGAAYGH